MQDHQQPRIDGSIHDDRAPEAEPEAAYVAFQGERACPRPKVSGLLEGGGVQTVIIQISPRVAVQLHSEEQARALIGAAGRAAAMFATANAAPIEWMPPSSIEGAPGVTR